MMEYLERGYVLYAMLGICVICVLGKLIANGTYKRLIRQAENMASAKDSFLKRLKLKYESTYSFEEGVNNVPAFVEKNLYQYKKNGDNFETAGKSGPSMGPFSVCWPVSVQPWPPFGTKPKSEP